MRFRDITSKIVTFVTSVVKFAKKALFIKGFLLSQI